MAKFIKFIPNPISVSYIFSWITCLHLFIWIFFHKILVLIHSPLPLLLLLLFNLTLSPFDLFFLFPQSLILYLWQSLFLLNIFSFLPNWEQILKSLILFNIHFIVIISLKLIRDIKCLFLLEFILRRLVFWLIKHFRWILWLCIVSSLLLVEFVWFLCGWVVRWFHKVILLYLI